MILNASFSIGPPASTPPRGAAFTLVELLVVIGIIVVLIAILMPSVVASTGPVTMADAFDNTGEATDRASFDVRRHRGKMNVAFVDGHVEAVNIVSGDRARV